MSRWPFLTNAFDSIIEEHGEAGELLHRVLELAFKQHDLPHYETATALNEATTQLLRRLAARPAGDALDAMLFDAIEQTVEACGQQHAENMPSEAWVINYTTIALKAKQRERVRSATAPEGREQVIHQRLSSEGT